MSTSFSEIFLSGFDSLRTIKQNKNIKVDEIVLMLLSTGFFQQM